MQIEILVLFIKEKKVINSKNLLYVTTSPYICIYGEGIQTELLHINIVFNILKVETRNMCYFLRHAEGFIPLQLCQKYWVCIVISMYKFICVYKIKIS